MMGSKELTRYRDAAMGFAILWIMAYHSGMSFSFLPVLGSAVNTFRSNGFGGVDLFLLLSGFGLYRSLSRNSEQLTFYRRRLKRILPAYLPVLAVWLFLKLPEVPAVSWPRVILGNLTGTAFWRGPSPTFNWYMLALYSFYFIAPFLFQVMQHPGGTGYVLAGTLLLDACFYGHHVMIAVVRFTVFALGMAMGRWFAGGGQVNLALELFLYAAGLFSYWLLMIFRSTLSGDFLWSSGLYWYPFIFTAPAILLLLCRLFFRMERRAPWALRIFELSGRCSLEIYLIHIVAFSYIHPQSNKAWPFVYAAMVLCGYIYHTAIAKMMARLPSIRRTRCMNPCQGAAGKETCMKTHVEFLRIAAAFLVIVNHTNSDIFLTRAPSPTWFCSLTYFFICKTAVPLFLYIMGGLLLGKKDSPKKTAERLLHSFIVLTAASACYYIYYAHQRNTETGLGDFLQGLFKKNVSVALWYLYLYLGLLCLLPILQRLAQALSRRQLEYLLFLSLGVCGTAPLITVFWPDFVLSGYFTAGLIGPYIGQVMLGYYIERYVPMRKKVFWPALCGFVLLIVFQVAGTFLLYRRDPSSYTALDNRTFITITGSAACLYICVKYLFAKYPPGPRVSQAVCRLGRLTFGIYLMADMARTQFSAPVYGRMIAAGLHPLVAMVLWELFIFTVCALATAALRLVPPLRKWL